MKAVVQFRGREIAHADLGKKLLMRFAEDLAAYGAVESQPRMEGRNAHILISPASRGKPRPKAQPPVLPPEHCVTASVLWAAASRMVRFAKYRLRASASMYNAFFGFTKIRST